MNTKSVLIIQFISKEKKNICNSKKSNHYILFNITVKSLYLRKNVQQQINKSRDFNVSN